MASELAKAFDGALNIRKAIRREIVSQLLLYETSGRNYFSTYHTRANDDVVRKLRTHAKRRQHIYNYERERARDHWTKTIVFNRDYNNVLLAKYDNGAKVMTINTNHHPLLVKVLSSEMAMYHPTVKIQLIAYDHPQFSWNEENEQARTENIVQFVQSTNVNSEYVDYESSMEGFRYDI